MQYREFKFFLDKRLVKKRFDLILQLLFFQFSRNSLVSLILRGFCKIDLYIVKQVCYFVCNYCVLSVNFFFLNKLNWVQQKLDLNVLFVDSNIIVVEKEFNILIHPTKKTFTKTLINVLLYYFPELLQLPRAGVVHRLDESAAGLVIIARTLFTYYSLVFQFRNKLILKFYNSFVSGQFFFSGVIRKQLYNNFLLSSKRLTSAITNVRVQNVYSYYTHIRVYPQTGKLHQIRKHLSLLGYPILGDFLYGFRIKDIFFENIISSQYRLNKKIMLQATSILFLHPFLKRYVFFTLVFSNKFL